MKLNHIYNIKFIWWNSWWIELIRSNEVEGDIGFLLPCIKKLDLKIYWKLCIELILTCSFVPFSTSIRLRESLRAFFYINFIELYFATIFFYLKNQFKVTLKSIVNFQVLLHKWLFFSFFFFGKKSPFLKYLLKRTFFWRKKKPFQKSTCIFKKRTGFLLQKWIDIS